MEGMEKSQEVKLSLLYQERENSTFCVTSVEEENIFSYRMQSVHRNIDTVICRVSVPQKYAETVPVVLEAVQK